jgi:hypothetical protein
VTEWPRDVAARLSPGRDSTILPPVSDASDRDAASRPAIIALVAAAALCALAAQRQLHRDQLALGGAPVALPATPPMALVWAARPIPGRPAPKPLGPTDLASPPPVGSGSTARAAPQPAGSAARGAKDVEAMAVETFADARPGLTRCLREARQTDGDAAGRLPVTVQVDRAGLVSQVALGPSPLRSASFDECATLTLAELVFLEPLHGRELSITYDLK